MQAARACLCGHALSAAALLDAATGLCDPNLMLLGALCPACGQGITFQATDGRLEAGYTYWSGSMHFEGVLPIACPGLSVQRQAAPRGIHVSIGERTWRFHVPA